MSVIHKKDLTRAEKEVGSLRMSMQYWSGFEGTKVFEGGSWRGTGWLLAGGGDSSKSSTVQKDPVVQAITLH